MLVAINSHSHAAEIKRKYFRISNIILNKTRFEKYSMLQFRGIYVNESNTLFKYPLLEDKDAVFKDEESIAEES